MKVGDNVYCIKKYEDMFSVNMMYSIYHIDHDSVFMEYNNGSVHFFYLPSSVFYQYRKFSEYFVTVKEYRKLKLDKISKI